MNVQNKINEFLQSNIAESVGWLLLNSLWQIVVLAIIYSIFKLFVSNPRARYICSVSLLFVLVSCVAVTFVFEPNSTQTSQVETDINPQASSPLELSGANESPMTLLDDEPSSKVRHAEISTTNHPVSPLIEKLDQTDSSIVQNNDDETQQQQLISV